ncbi:hypothetical protein ACFQV8_37425 [Pseudonocardia benzenivorans]
MTTVPSGSSSAPGSVPPLFAAFVDDTSLLLANGGAGVDAVVEGYLDARDGDHGDLLGRLACPVSRLSPLVTELARSAPRSRSTWPSSSTAAWAPCPRRCRRCSPARPC